jgi:hypothetical protein
MNIKKILILLLLFSFILGCTTSTKKEQFELFIADLKPVTLPFYYDSGKEVKHFQGRFKNDVDSIFFKYGPSFHKFIGYYIESNTIRILSLNCGDFFRNLTITTFDKEGNMLNNVTPSFNGCTGIPINFEKCKELIILNTDNKIIATELKIIKLPGNGDTIIKKTKNYRLDIFGRLKEE